MGKKSFSNLPKDLSGKVFVITGTTSGTGFIAAKVIAERGGEVVMLNRQSPRVDAAMKKLLAEVPNGTFVAVDCNLQDFESVRKAGQEIVSKYDKIYCLANNAGIMGSDDKATKDGYDIQMQTNHLSHFLLTSILFPLIAAGAQSYGEARIVQHSSGGRHGDGNGRVGTREGWSIEEKYYGPNGGNLGGNEIKNMVEGAPFERYFQSKLANSLFMRRLHDLCQSKPEYKNIRSIACQPGIAHTNLAAHFGGDNPSFLMKTMVGLYYRIMFQSGEAGTQGLLLAMAQSDAKSGELYGPLNQRKGPPHPNKPEKYETDTSAMDLMWKLSEDAVGVKFNI